MVPLTVGAPVLPLNFARVARLAAFFLAASLSFPSLASPSEDANAAYRNGDYATALLLWSELAQQGDATAQSRLGVMYRDGRGVPRDNQRAVEWFRKAAEQGNASAQNNLGVMYENGRGGLPKDDKQAVEWYRKASEQGDAFGQNNLGVMYRYGRGGLPPDENQAVDCSAEPQSRAMLSVKPTLVQWTQSAGVACPRMTGRR